jgi:glucokinase
MESLAAYPRLVGDIRANQARFALVEGPDRVPTRVAAYPATCFSSLHSALDTYLAEQRQRPRWAALGVASPVLADTVHLTNSPWRFSARHLKQQMGFERLVVINDFAALAMALPRLKPSQYWALAGGQGVPGAPLALLGPDAGLGASGLLPHPAGGHRVVAAEGGHATLSAANALEAELLRVLRMRFGHVSAERVVSGPGLVNLYQGVNEIHGLAGLPLSEADITAAALGHLDLGAYSASCHDTLQAFCGFLGSVAGDLALTLGAYGGVYLGGPIVPRLGECLARSPFRARFEGQGLRRQRLADVPNWVIRADATAALLGVAQALA